MTGPDVLGFTLPPGGFRAALERARARRAGEAVPDLPPPDAGLREKIAKGVAFADFVKRDLADRGLTSDQYQCPCCEAPIGAVVTGPKRHLRLACATPGCLTVVE
jgi:hypothetical protein